MSWIKNRIITSYSEQSIEGLTDNNYEQLIEVFSDGYSRNAPTDSIIFSNIIGHKVKNNFEKVNITLDDDLKKIKVDNILSAKIEYVVIGG